MFKKLNRFNYESSEDQYNNLKKNLNKFRQYEEKILLKPMNNQSENEKYKKAIERRFISNLNLV